MSGCSPLAFASEIEVNRGVDMVAVLKVVTDESDTHVTLAYVHDAAYSHPPVLDTPSVLDTLLELPFQAQNTLFLSKFLSHQVQTLTMMDF